MSSSQQQAPAIPAPPPAPVNPGDPGGGPTIMAVTWTLSTVAILIVGARFYVRGRVNGKISMDDWFMLAAMVCSLPPYLPAALPAAAAQEQPVID